MKTCVKCGTELPLEEFYGHHSDCSMCAILEGKLYYQEHKAKSNAESNAYHQMHREKCLQLNKDRRRELKLDVLQHYSGGTPECSCCNERRIEFLVIDHIDGGGNEHRKTVKPNRLHRWLIDNNYPPGFRVLCSNCNTSFGAFGYCPHQKER